MAGSGAGSLAGRSVGPHLATLRAVGFCRVREGGGTGAHALYRAAVLATTSLYLLQECVYAYQVTTHVQLSVLRLYDLTTYRLLSSFHGSPRIH